MHPPARLINPTQQKLETRTTRKRAYSRKGFCQILISSQLTAPPRKTSLLSSIIGWMASNMGLAWSSCVTTMLIRSRQIKKTIEKFFTKIVGMPTDKHVIRINIWRSLSDDPLEPLPLAVRDRASIDPNDLRYSLNPEAQKPFNSHFGWTNDEHFHTAVAKPESDHLRPRESIEIRFFSFSDLE